MKYLTLIRAIALLHQYQREVKTAEHEGKAVRYIEVTKQDIALANGLAHEVLGRSLDELPPQTRRLLSLVSEMVAKQSTEKGLDACDLRFTRRHVRETTGWGNTQLKIHLHRLEELEYLVVHAGGRGQSFVYELAYEGDAKADAPFLAGLIDIEALETHDYDPNRSGSGGPWSGSSRAQVGPKPGGGRGAESAENDRCDEDLQRLNGERVENALPGKTGESRSYVPEPPPSLVAGRDAR